MEPTRFDPTAKGWVVRIVTRFNGHQIASWWYGPAHGWGTTSGPLDYDVAVWPTRKAAEDARAVWGRRRPSCGDQIVERVADAVAFAIVECDRGKAAVLAGDRPDRAEIAEANDRAKAYLQGERSTRR